MTDYSDCRCIRCDGDLIGSTSLEPDATIPGAIQCVSCKATYDQVWGVPVLTNYEEADFAALVETAANAELRSPFTPQGLDHWDVILRDYHVSTDKAAFLESIAPGDARYVPNRYTEWEALERLTSGETFDGLKVLDIGAGLGFDAFRLVRAGAVVTALEFSPVLAREGKRTLPMMRWFGGVSHALPFKTGAFGAVFCNAALHHMRDIPAAFSEMLRVLRPGGLLITTGDPYRADNQDEKAEMAIFNSHPDVLGGINEGVPRLGEFLETLEAVKDSTTIQLFTQTLYPPGGGKEEGFRAWDFERDAAWLRRTSGGIAIKVRLEREAALSPRRQGDGRTLRPAMLAEWLTSQSETMAKLAAWAPETAVNAPFPGAEGTKFELLNGWRMPTGRSWRQAYRRARWFLSRTEEEKRLTFDLSTFKRVKFKFLLNGRLVGTAVTEGGSWKSVEIDIGASAAGVPFAFEIQQEELPADFNAGLFQVRHRRLMTEHQAVQPHLFTRARNLVSGLKRGLLRTAFGDDATIDALGLARHKVLAASGDHSFAGEEAQIRALLTRLGLDSGHVVDIAASDGVTQSCTLGLFRSDSWRGLAVEFDARKFARLAYAYSAFPWVDLAKCKVTPENVVSLLRAHNLPRTFELLSLDIDSYDLFVIAAILEAGFRPKLISMEINEKIPPPIYFTVLYDDAHAWREDHFFGCSAAAAAEIVRPFGYVLAGVEYNNAMFVSAGLAEQKGVSDQDVAQAYGAGYRDRADRAKLFPWNQDVDEVLSLGPAEALEFFERHFEGYKGKFELRMAKPQSALADASLRSGR